MNKTKGLDKLGCGLFVIALAFFTFIAYELLGVFGVIIGPLVALAAARPSKDGGPWIWESKRGITEG